MRDRRAGSRVAGLDLSAFATIRRDAGDPEVLVYNAGYLEGRDLPPEKELLEYVPVEMLDTGLHVAARGPFLVAQQVLPAMRKKGRGRSCSRTTPALCAGASGIPGNRYTIRAF